MDEEMRNSEMLMYDSMKNGSMKFMETAGNRAANWIIDFTKKKFGEAFVLGGDYFNRYLENAKARYNRIKTIATGRDPRSILEYKTGVGPKSIYIEIGVSYHNKEIPTTTVNPLLNISHNILIEGNGGAGKSMLLRYLFLDTAEREEYIPILLELRKINVATTEKGYSLSLAKSSPSTKSSRKAKKSDKKGIEKKKQNEKKREDELNQKFDEIPIMDLIYTCMREFDVELPKEQFEFSLRSGKYLFLMDGFDEIKERISVGTAKAIQAFTAKYPENPCIITSRPILEGKTSLLETFTVVESMPLSSIQAVQLASKIWDEDEKTKEFCRQLEVFYYDDEHYKSFSQNPLLLSLMFLTFMRNNSIPDHLAEFYEEAFDALYNVHDTSNKGYYLRDFRCGILDKSEFKKLFARFCFTTYFNQQYEFSRPEILTALQNAIIKAKYEDYVDAEDCLQDLRRAVCMIIQDGETYLFSHRSFQTYFAAFFTAVLPDNKQHKLFETILQKEIYWSREDYFSLLAQIEPERFATNAIEATLRTIQKESVYDPAINPNIAFLKAISSGFSIDIIDGQEFISMIVPNQYGEYAKYNAVRIFTNAVYHMENDHITENMDAIRVWIKRWLKIDDEDFRKCYKRDFTYSQVDSSGLLNIEEQQNFYDAICEYHQIQETRLAIQKWLTEQDNKEKYPSVNTLMDIIDSF